uniref:Glycosylphosphatidylinositol anchored high density lipoprotein binding protein 1 n=1 Tax=Molossus molossus TaxID=27622 RepID=A0A7J8BAA5_MOLMO|nr:glycosylphosphatidylinositol anchored high density lipoprotein binding protein 1 [Molossus molossus]
MKTLATVLLALLLCRQPGRGQAWDELDDGEDTGQEDYEDEDEEDEEDEEAGRMAGSRDRGLQCYSCQSLRREDRCHQTSHCPLSQPFCKTLTSQGDTESGPLTTYSAWCADTCKFSTRTVEETLVTVTCCQTTLCNIPPWQGGGAGGPQGSPQTVAAALLLSLLLGLGAMGS